MALPTSTIKALFWTIFFFSGGFGWFWWGLLGGRALKTWIWWFDSSKNLPTSTGEFDPVFFFFFRHPKNGGLMTFNSKPEMLLVTLVRYAKKKLSFSETHMKKQVWIACVCVFFKLFELSVLLGIFLTNPSKSLGFSLILVWKGSSQKSMTFINVHDCLVKIHCFCQVSIVFCNALLHFPLFFSQFGKKFNFLKS